ncbi:hypothetical protein ACFPN0_29070 [Kitasatospora cinereorecta]
MTRTPEAGLGALRSRPGTHGQGCATDRTHRSNEQEMLVPTAWGHVTSSESCATLVE